MFMHANLLQLQECFENPLGILMTVIEIISGMVYCNIY